MQRCTLPCVLRLKDNRKTAHSNAAVITKCYLFHSFREKENVSAQISAKLGNWRHNSPQNSMMSFRCFILFRLRKEPHPLILHPVIPVKPHNDMWPVNRSVRLEPARSDSDVLIRQETAVLAVMLQQRRYLGPKDQYHHSRGWR